MLQLTVGSAPCHCTGKTHAPRLVAVTGGPGAGKTAVLELARRTFCRHVAILPEAAGILFGGGFPRHDTDSGRRAAQRAIYRVQSEVERLVVEEANVAVALCDRGTLDGLAYWPGDHDSYWRECMSTRAAELDRYAAVVHLETPGEADGYDRTNSLRVESAAAARIIDLRIREAWAGHPRAFFVRSAPDFAAKALEALQRLRDELPDCCHAHDLPGEQRQGSER